MYFGASPLMEKERKMKTTTIITAIIAIFLAVVAPIAYLQSNGSDNAPLEETLTGAFSVYRKSRYPNIYIKKP